MSKNQIWKILSPNDLPKNVLFPALDRFFKRNENEKSPISVQNLAFDDEETKKNPFDEDQTTL